MHKHRSSKFMAVIVFIAFAILMLFIAALKSHEQAGREQPKRLMMMDGMYQEAHYRAVRGMQ